MAITPVKTGNVTMSPLAKTTDPKLTTQFNAAAVKAGTTEATKAPSTSTPPPFYTPEAGSFKEVRKLGGKGYNARLNWQVNEAQQEGTNKVFIKGSVTVDWGTEKTNYVIDGYNSYIDSTGKIFYNVKQLGGTYGTSFNLFNKIESDVKTTLKEVKKNEEFALDKNGKSTPVSLASGRLSVALDAVGEYNLLRGVGLNGAGSRIKKLLAVELAKKKNETPKQLLIRQAVALAMTASGVKVKLPGGTAANGLAAQIKVNRDPTNMTPVELADFNARNGVLNTINYYRAELNIGNRQLTPGERTTLLNNVQRHFENANARWTVAADYARQVAVPGVLTARGLNAVQIRNLITPIRRYLEGAQRPLEELLAQMQVPADTIEAFTDLLGFDNPINQENLADMIDHELAFVNANTNLTRRVDNAAADLVRRAFVAMGQQMRNINFGSDL